MPYLWDADSNANSDCISKPNAFRYRDTHANAHSDCYGDANSNRDSYGYIHDGAECYTNSYSYCNYSSDSDGYSTADTQSTATCNTALAAHASTKAITEQL